MQLARRPTARHKEGLPSGAARAILDAADHRVLLARRLSNQPLVKMAGQLFGREIVGRYK